MDQKKYEIRALCVFTVTLLLFFSLASFHPSDLTLFNASSVERPPENWVGVVGAHIAWILYFLFGMASFSFSILGFWVSWSLFSGKAILPHGRLQALGIGLFILTLMTLFSIHFPKVAISGGEVPSGGEIGSILGHWLLARLYAIGTHVLLFGAFFISLLLSTPLTLKSLSQGLYEATAKSTKFFSQTLSQKFNRQKSLNRDPNVRRGATHPRKKKKSSGNGSRELVETGDALEVDYGEQGEPPPSLVSDEKPSLQLPAPKPGEYVLPPLDLLENHETKTQSFDPATLESNAKVLQEKLRDFGVQGEVVDILPGPVITMYEYAPAPGIKISRIVSLSDDLSMALKAVSIRVVAPIPGKAAIGIEVPNDIRELVSMRDVVESKAFWDTSARLTIVLGKDITGRPVIANLAKMPHLLIAGATGTGKSVCINALLTSLLYRNVPEDVRLLLIDPKRIELSSYEGIPHLVHPVVTDAKKATRALRWAVEEMELRYKLLAEKNVRNIESYNRVIEKEKEAAVHNETPVEEEPSLAHHRLPFIVIIIDELADLMMVASREVEESITRLAQMARACGIHLILATQRPSVDVLTGIIKANIPTRISFQVSSRVDSRTILDGSGAETLLGSGDMLFVPPGTAKLQRIHGAFVSDAEVQRVTEFWKVQQLGEDPLSDRVDFEEKSSEGEMNSDELDEKYEEAVQLVLETRQASISMLQRRLRVGYNRAARMIEMMEQQGIVGASDGIKPREVLGN